MFVDRRCSTLRPVHAHGTIPMNVQQEVLNALDEALSLRGRAQKFSRDTLLLGDLPELDSMAVVTVITTLEDRFGIIVHDDEIDGDTFASVGALSDFVQAKLG
jgi:acyl carrier protein